MYSVKDFWNSDPGKFILQVILIFLRFNFFIPLFFFSLGNWLFNVQINRNEVLNGFYSINGWFLLCN